MQQKPTHRFKLFADGQLFELDGRYNETPVAPNSLTAEAVAARDLLEVAISRFRDARPEDLREAAAR